jgi:hypothetical protein
VKGLAIARTPRPRRQVRPATLRIARLIGFRYDAGRDAYVLRLVGNRFGPVLRSAPHDSAAVTFEWPEEMQEEERRRRTGRFARDRQAPASGSREETLRQ